MSVQIGKIKGIPIRLHFTLIIVFFLITWTLATGFMPLYFPKMSTIEYWTMGVFGAILLFVSVLLHELAHSIVSLRYGFQVRQIILFIFGGVSDIPKEPKDFRQEFRIAIVGPATSFALAGIFALAWWIISQNTVELSALRVVEGVIMYGAILNGLVGVFNLIPAFPLDGGRVLRAALLKYKKDYDQATKIATKIGIGISYAFMAFGFIIMFTGSFISGIWLLFIGWFLNSGAQSYLSQHELTSALAGVRLRHIMNTGIISINDQETIDDSLRNYFSKYMKSAFPVVNNTGVLVGMASLSDVMQVPEERRSATKIEEIMTPKANLVVMTEDRAADEALMQMTRKRAGKTFICDSNGQLVGLVSKTDLLNVANERMEYEQKAKKSGDKAHRLRLDEKEGRNFVDTDTT